MGPGGRAHIREMPEVGPMVLSRRTVEKHVEHLLTKLGRSTRAHIAAWAVWAGLAGDPEMRTHHARSP